MTANGPRQIYTSARARRSPVIRIVIAVLVVAALALAAVAVGILLG